MPNIEEVLCNVRYSSEGQEKVIITMNQEVDVSGMQVVMHCLKFIFSSVKHVLHMCVS